MFTADFTNASKKMEHLLKSSSEEWNEKDNLYKW